MLELLAENHPAAPARFKHFAYQRPARTARFAVKLSNHPSFGERNGRAQRRKK